MKKLILFIAAICLIGSEANASHLAGGELWYEYVSGNTYVLKARLYRDCAGIAVPTTINVCYSAASISAPATTVALTQDTTYALDLCTPNSCTGPFFSNPGFEAAEYSQTVTLSGPATDWHFWYSMVARSNNSNLTFGSNMFVESTLDNSTVPFNNIAFPYLPINLNQYVGSTNTINFPTLDIDGDSLDFVFTSPLSHL